MSTMRKLRYVIAGAGCLLLLSTAFTIYRKYNIADEVSGDEQVFCASALCFFDQTVGKECLEFSPRISRLSVVEDSRNGTQRLVVEATGNSCKKGP